jgi:hypothetical protein
MHKLVSTMTRLQPGDTTGVASIETQAAPNRIKCALTTTVIFVDLAHWISKNRQRYFQPLSELKLVSLQAAEGETLASTPSFIPSSPCSRRPLPKHLRGADNRGIKWDLVERLLARGM